MTEFVNFVLPVVVFVFAYTVWNTLRCAWVARREERRDAERRAAAEERFRKQMGIVEDPGYESPTSEDDRRWAENGVSRRR